MKHWLSALLLAAASLPPPLHAAETPVEFRLKAAFLLNFAKLVQWPAERFKNPQDNLRLCVLGPDPFGNALDETVTGKRIGGRAVSVRRAAKPEELLDCHLVYLAPGERPRYAADLRALSGRSILTVDEGTQFSRPLGMIRFYLEQERVRFELNPAAMEQAQLLMDPKLVKIAKLVSP